jgi:hypothetical protein
MKSTSSRLDLASDLAVAGAIRASRQPVARSIWVLLAMAVLAVATPMTSDAKPQATCKSMCQRLTDCKMPSYTKMCLDACKQYGYEASEAGRAQLLTFTKYSCKQIQSAVGGTDGQQHQGASTRSSSPRNSSPRPPAPSNPYDDDYGDDGYDDDTGRTASGSDRGRRSYQSASGNDPGDTSCSWVCGRLSECNLVSSSQSCGKFCSTVAGSAHPLRIGRESCAEIKKAFVTDKWMCWAEGSTGYAYGNGPWSYRAKSIPADGRTRDEASLQALRDCNALLGFSANLDNLSGAATDNGMCKVTRCFPPGTPLGPLL